MARRVCSAGVFIALFLPVAGRGDDQKLITGRIESLDADAGTVTIVGQDAETTMDLRFGSASRIEIDRKAAEVAQLSVGMKVSVFYRGDTIVKLRVIGAAPQDPAPEDEAPARPHTDEPPADGETPSDAQPTLNDWLPVEVTVTAYETNRYAARGEAVALRPGASCPVRIEVPALVLAGDDPAAATTALLLRYLPLELAAVRLDAPAGLSGTVQRMPGTRGTLTLGTAFLLQLEIAEDCAEGLHELTLIVPLKVAEQKGRVSLKLQVQVDRTAEPPELQPYVPASLAQFAGEWEHAGGSSLDLKQDGSGTVVLVDAGRIVAAGIQVESIGGEAFVSLTIGTESSTFRLALNDDAGRLTLQNVSSAQSARLEFTKTD